MTIQEKVKSELHTSIKVKDEAMKSVLRVLLGEFDRVGKAVGDKDAIGIVKKMRQNATEQGNLVEATILDRFLPEQLEGEALKKAVADAVDQLGAKGDPRRMGQVMGSLSKKYPGMFDGKVASAMVKEEISG